MSRDNWSRQDLEREVLGLTEALNHLRTEHEIEAGKWDEQHARQHAVNTKQAKEIDSLRTEVGRLRAALTNLLGGIDQWNDEIECTPTAIRELAERARAALKATEGGAK